MIQWGFASKSLFLFYISNSTYKMSNLIHTTVYILVMKYSTNYMCQTCIAVLIPPLLLFMLLQCREIISGRRLSGRMCAAWRSALGGQKAFDCLGQLAWGCCHRIQSRTASLPCWYDKCRICQTSEQLWDRLWDGSSRLCLVDLTVLFWDYKPVFAESLQLYPHWKL